MAELSCVAHARACKEGGGTVRKGKGGGPLGWLVSRSYKRESLVAAHGRRATTTLKAASLPISAALEKLWRIRGLISQSCGGAAEFEAESMREEAAVVTGGEA